MSAWDAVAGLAGGGGPTAAVVALLVALGGLVAAYLKGRGDKSRGAKLDQARKDEAAHRRMNNAPDHRGKSDAELRGGLRDLAERIDRKR